MRFSKAWLFWVFSLIPLISASGQSDPLDRYTFNLKFHYGFVLKHSSNMAHLANQRPWGLEADVYRSTAGRKQWEKEHRFPIIGYAFQYYHMDKDKPLGDSYSLVLYYGKECLKSKRGALSWRLGTGMAYIERRFNKYTNYKNNLISNRLNFTLYGRLNYTWRITDLWNVNFGIGLTHHSNGATHVPNLGINIPAVFVGIGYRPGIPERPEKPILEPFRAVTQYHFSLAGGLKRIFPIEGPTYLIYNFSGYVARRVNFRSALSIGSDFMYDGSNKIMVDSLGLGKMEYNKWGLTVGHEFFIHRLSLLTQIGYYLYDPLKKDKAVYQRLGLKYYFHENLFGTVALKTHFGSADYVEWGVGIRLE